MAGTGAILEPDPNLEVEVDLLKSQSTLRTKEEDKTDATNISLLNVSVKLSINNSGNRVSQDQNLQYAREPLQRLEQLGQTQQEQQRLRRVYSLIPVAPVVLNLAKSSVGRA